MYNRQLDTFLTVADCGSFGKAAEQLYISTPATIQQINLLVDRLCFSVFSLQSWCKADCRRTIHLPGRQNGYLYFRGRGV